MAFPFTYKDLTYLYFAVGEDEDPIWVHDGVESVRDGEDGAVLEPAPDGLLDQLIRFVTWARSD